MRSRRQLLPIQRIGLRLELRVVPSRAETRVHLDRRHAQIPADPEPAIPTRRAVRQGELRLHAAPGG